MLGALALWLSATGGTGQASVALVGGATLGGLPAAQGAARRWPVALTTFTALAVVGVATFDDGDGWGRTLVGVAAGAVVALAAAATLGFRWWTWTGAWCVGAAMAAAALLVVPDDVAVHRLAVTALAVALLVAVARGFSKLVLRLTTVAVLVATVGALAWIGDRTGLGAADGTPADPDTTLELAATEALALREELPCDADEVDAPDARLCSALDTLATRADDARRRDDAGAVAGVEATLGRLREEVAIRVLPGDEERPARVAMATDLREATGGNRMPADAERAGDGHDVRELTVAGVDAVVGDALDPFTGDGTDVRLGVTGWIVLGLLGALGYRRLEVINNRRYGGPLRVAEVVAAGGDGESATLTAVVRNRIAELELCEPSPVPGAATAAPPTAPAVGALDADVMPRGARRLTAVLRVARGAVFPAAGLTVVAAHSGPAPRPRAGRAAGTPEPLAGDGAPTGVADQDEDGAPADHVMSVRLASVQEGRTIRAASFRRTSASTAAQAAADFVVCDAVARSHLTPSWAQWWSDDGAALGPYQAVVTDTGRTGPRLALRDQIELLETARAASPATGLITVELGHRYDLDERPLDALRTHLATRALHPRCAPARYRAATSLSMLAAPGRFDEHWLDPARTGDRRRIADLLVENGLVDRARRGRWWRIVRPRCPDDPADLRAWLAQDDPEPAMRREILKVLLVVARTELVGLERRMSYPGLLAGATRQAERHVWLGYVGHPARRRATLASYRSARWIAELRLALIPAQPGTAKARALQRKVDAMAARPDVASTALYNAACFTSVLAGRSPAKGTEQAELQDRAVRYLGRLTGGGPGPVPSSGWMTTDPDLVALQAVPAFNDLVRRLADDEDRRTASTSGTA